MSYHQPPEAPFTHDSIEIAHRLAELVVGLLNERRVEGSRGDLPEFQFFDLCAGCGVVGFEFERKLGKMPRLKPFSRKWTFVEVQERYRDYFERNLKELLREPTRHMAQEFRFLNLNYKNLIGNSTFHESADVLVSNPPYFEQGQGRLPPLEVKARSRFFLDASFTDFLECVSWVLKPGGVALFLVRDLSDHKIGRESEIRRNFFNDRFQWTWCEPIRGTGVVMVRKLRV